MLILNQSAFEYYKIICQSFFDPLNLTLVGLDLISVALPYKSHSHSFYERAARFRVFGDCTTVRRVKSAENCTTVWALIYWYYVTVKKYFNVYYLLWKPSCNQRRLCACAVQNASLSGGCWESERLWVLWNRETATEKVTTLVANRMWQIKTTNRFEKLLDLAIKSKLSLATLTLRLWVSLFKAR